MPEVTPPIFIQDSITITKATTKHIPQLAELFDLYRQFYKEDANITKAKQYLGERIKKKDATIYIAFDNNQQAVGFTQLYPSLCSVEGGLIWILYDLFVLKSARNQSIAKQLMESARLLAVDTNALRIDLETAIDNLPAQSLYEQLGYERDTEFYKYSLDI